MKQALIAVGAILLAFVVGLAGVYFAMPALSPEITGKVQARRDSLAVIDSLISLGLLPDSPYFLPDSLVQSDSLTMAQSDSLAMTLPDSLAMTLPDSLAMTLPDSLAAAGLSSDGAFASSESETVLPDSMTVLQHSVEGLIQENGELIEQLKALREQVEGQQTQGTKAQELSSTLSKLEDKELAGVVEQLDVALLAMLYKNASGRNRTRLLQAMSPQVAANFVQHLMQPGRVAVSDTLSAGSKPLP